MNCTKTLTISGSLWGFFNNSFTVVVVRMDFQWGQFSPQLNNDGYCKNIPSVKFTCI